MKVWGVSMVRNEADVIEAFVRHNLAFLDGLAVMDHRSTDGTFELLAKLKADGLSIARLRDTETAFFQGARITALARECFARTGADFVLPLDADEFIRSRSRGELEEALGALTPGVYGRQPWRSYVPTAFEGPFGPHCLRRRLREERIQRYKVVLPRAFSDRTHEMVSEGSHWIADMHTGQPAAYEFVAAEKLSLAHCPVRSRAQMENKIRVGYESLVAAGGLAASMAYHWRDVYEDVSRGVPLTDDRLRLIASNYTIPREQWLQEVDLVTDPVELRMAGSSAIAADRG